MTGGPLTGPAYVSAAGLCASGYDASGCALQQVALLNGCQKDGAECLRQSGRSPAAPAFAPGTSGAPTGMPGNAIPMTSGAFSKGASRGMPERAPRQHIYRRWLSGSPHDSLVHATSGGSTADRPCRPPSPESHCQQDVLLRRRTFHGSGCLCASDLSLAHAPDACSWPSRDSGQRRVHDRAAGKLHIVGWQYRSLSRPCPPGSLPSAPGQAFRK